MRWDHTRFTADAGALDAAQVLQDTGAGTAVQKYLRGLREVPVTWPQEALRAQVVAARTYLLGKYSSTAKAYVLRTTTADQNYGGAAHEDEDARHGGGWRAAVDATPGRVVVDAAGKRIDALYSSSAGGWTEDRQYVWGSYGIDYLKPLDDSAWDAASDNPYRAWAVGLTRAQVATALGFDSVASVSVAARGSGARVGGVTVTGVDGGRSTTRTFTGDRVRTALRLRSSGVTFRVAGTATTAAPAPAVPAPSGPPVSAPVVGDWDADGRDDAGWYASGRWTLRRGDGTVVRLAFGSASDVPVVGDWDGDGRDGVGVYRKGHWFLRGALSTGPADAHLAYGATTDRPVVGAWAGGARDGVGVVRGNQWLLRPTATPGPPTVRALLGRASDGLLPGDWDGDGVDSPGVRRGGTSYLAARSSTTAVPTTAVPFGGAADRAVAGDWDGDRRATPGVVRGTAWHLRDDLRGGAATRSYALVP
jgi:SpoIID/LytB domain protein